ncbi:hypothetical protein ACS0TY_012382 [Phlomoides rotata]
MVLALEQNTRRVWIEVDSQLLADAVNKPRENISSFGCVVKDILDLKFHFDFVKFSWIKRVGNAVAHSLASLAHILDEPLISSVLPDAY